jgi:hypothetical protein
VVPQALWGFGHGARGGYPVRAGAQLKRYGTNVAIWGFNVCALRDFNDLRGGKNGKTRALDNLRAMSLATRERQHRRTDSRGRRKSWFAEPNLFRSPRQDSRRALAAVLSDVTASAHWFVCRYFSQAVIHPDDAGRIVFAFSTALSLRQRASFVINNLFAGG